MSDTVSLRPSGPTSLPASAAPARSSASQANANRGVSAGQAPRIAHAAKEFESVLLGQWLQSAEKSFGSVPGGSDEEDSGGEQMQSFAMQQLATAITASGGIGIARLVSQALAKADATSAGASEREAQHASGR
jgi:Rod binding domain-containing protein